MLNNCFEWIIKENFRKFKVANKGPFVSTDGLTVIIVHICESCNTGVCCKSVIGLGVGVGGGG